MCRKTENLRFIPLSQCTLISVPRTSNPDEAETEVVGLNWRNIYNNLDELRAGRWLIVPSQREACITGSGGLRKFQRGQKSGQRILPAYRVPLIASPQNVRPRLQEGNERPRETQSHSEIPGHARGTARWLFQNRLRRTVNARSDSFSSTTAFNLATLLARTERLDLLRNSPGERTAKSITSGNEKFKIRESRNRSPRPSLI